jgi:hypothetical protein
MTSSKPASFSTLLQESGIKGACARTVVVFCSLLVMVAPFLFVFICTYFLTFLFFLSLSLYLSPSPFSCSFFFNRLRRELRPASSNNYRV